MIRRVLANYNIVSHVVYPPCKIADLHSSRQKSNDVASVGRIAIEKRHEDTLSIARRLPNVRFVILGEIHDAPHHRRLLKAKPSNVNIVTPTRNKFRELLREYLTKSKIYISLADDEAFGITIVEAMASGYVPIVCNAAGPREIVTSESGFKWDSLTEAIMYISQILSNEELREKLSSNAVERAKAFSLEAYQKRLIEIIQKL